jgi:hypothetical protein
MSMRYARMSAEYSDALDVANFIFSGVFNIECFLKLIAMGKAYFYSDWNK